MQTDPDITLGETKDPNLAQRAHQGIRQMMFLNQIAPGQKINLRHVARHLGMSPTPVVQALKWLEYQGLVDHERHRGYSYAPIDLEEVQELYDLRIAIESSLLPRALERATPEGILAMRQAYEAHVAHFHAQYIKRSLVSDMEFHLALAALSGSRIGVRFLRELFELFYLKYQAEHLYIRNLSAAITAHGRVLDGVERGDLDQTRSTLVTHIEEVRDAVLGGMRLAAEENLGLSF